MEATNGYDWNLKELMAEWKLDNIVSHLNDEQVNVDILEMMKVTHIRLLLYNFPIGVQIRFEYNLERWRRSIGKPLQVLVYDERIPFLLKDQQESDKNNSKNTTNDNLREQIRPSQPKMTQTDSEIKNTENNRDPLAITAIPSRELTNSNCSIASTSGAASIQQLNIQSQVASTSTATIANSTPHPHGPLPKVDLRHILSVVPHGVELINKYRDRKSFTTGQRAQLIIIIVNYYVDNHIEFNLQTSYALEQAIIQMFPNETLNSYRTNKRGKLYSRYLSVKSAMNFIRSGSGSGPNENSNMDYCTSGGGGGGVDGLSVDHFSDDSQMVHVRNTTGSVASNTSLAGEEDEDFLMEDAEYTIGFINEDEGDRRQIIADGEELSGEIKIELENANEASAIRAAVLKSQPDNRSFENIDVPWRKIPTDIIAMMDNNEKLGKRLNVLANLFVDELRIISIHIPTRVFRNITQQMVTKYPNSFLDYDAEGNITASATLQFMRRMRNRNNFLNR